MNVDEIYDLLLELELGTPATGTPTPRGRGRRCERRQREAGTTEVGTRPRPARPSRTTGFGRYRNAALVGAGGLACAAVGAFLGGLGGYFTVAPAAAHVIGATAQDTPLADAINGGGLPLGRRPARIERRRGGHAGRHGGLADQGHLHVLPLQRRPERSPRPPAISGVGSVGSGLGGRRSGLGWLGGRDAAASAGAPTSELDRQRHVHPGQHRIAARQRRVRRAAVAQRTGGRRDRHPLEPGRSGSLPTSTGLPLPGGSGGSGSLPLPSERFADGHPRHGDRGGRTA